MFRNRFNVIFLGLVNQLSVGQSGNEPHFTITKVIFRWYERKTTSWYSFTRGWPAKTLLFSYDWLIAELFRKLRGSLDFRLKLLKFSTCSISAYVLYEDLNPLHIHFYVDFFYVEFMYTYIHTYIHTYILKWRSGLCLKKDQETNNEIEL